MPEDSFDHSEKSRVAILTATRDLLETEGYDGLTIETIAAVAGVGKQTVYRYWGSKSAVVTDAVLDRSVSLERQPFESSGDVDADLRRMVGTFVQAMTGTNNASLIRAFVSAAVSETSLADRLWERGRAGPASRRYYDRKRTEGNPLTP